MTKPIAQTFYVNEPINGAEGVFLTAVDIYFQSVSSNYGVELQIRTTDNGNPTPYRLPGASKVLQVNDTYSSLYSDQYSFWPTGVIGRVIQSSKDASIPTRFIFDSPIPLQSQTSYALAIIPLSGNPDYTIWTAELAGGANKVDVLTKTPIFTNNDTGTLFLSSNDIQFTSIISEDIKFELFVANFTATSGTAVYEMDNEENIRYEDLIGSFDPNEFVFVSNGSFGLASLTVTSNTAAFTTAETLYQSNGSANVATATIYSANSSRILLTNTAGTWSTGYQVRGVSSTANAVISAVTTAVSTYSNNIISVPFTGNTSANVFYANQTIYVAPPNRSRMDARVVTGVINSTAISVHTNTAFTNTNCLFGRIKGDGGSLTGRYKGPQSSAIAAFKTNEGIINAFLWQSTANSTVNFAGSANSYLIGRSTGSSGRILVVRDMVYDAIVPQMASHSSQSTELNWTYSGIDEYNVIDSSSVPVSNYAEKEFKDKTRLLKSRSREYLTSNGAYTTKLTASLATSNNKMSPYIDKVQNYITFTKNVILDKNQTYGYKLNITGMTGKLQPGENIGDTVAQTYGGNTYTGTVLHANSSSIFVCDTTGPFTSGQVVYKVANAQINATATSSIEVNEKFSTNVFSAYSRYISKNVILAEQQDAEDLKCFITAYRPAKTDFLVYARFLHADDPDTVDKKIWSRMIELSSPALLSSGSNPDDFVELEYGIPASKQLLASGVICNTATANVTVSTTVGISNNDFIYIQNASANAFIVRQVSSVANNTTLVLTSTPSINATSAGIGLIPNLEHPTAGFLFANNNGIIRYVSSSDVVYDTYKTFGMKLVPIAENAAVIPRAADYRCLALQV